MISKVEIKLIFSWIGEGCCWFIYKESTRDLVRSRTWRPCSHLAIEWLLYLVCGAHLHAIESAFPNEIWSDITVLINIAGHTHDQISIFLQTLSTVLGFPLLILIRYITVIHRLRVIWSFSAIGRKCWENSLEQLKFKAFTKANTVQPDQIYFFCLCCHPSLDWFLNLYCGQRGRLNHTTKV